MGIRTTRRTFLAFALAATLALPASAQQMDQLTIMAPAAPGGGWDSTARVMQEVLQSAGIVKSVTVENVPGAGGTVGIAQFAKKKGDGKSLMVSGLVMVGAILSNKSPVTLADVTPIARLTSEWEAIAVPVNSELKTLDDLVAKLKADPGSVSWGGGSAGGTDHITAALFAKAVGVDPAKVNYIAHSGGGEAMASILGGHVTLGIGGASEFEPQVKAGQLRWLGVSSDQRIPDIDAPTFKEQGVDLVIGNWRAVMAPPGISQADREKLTAVIDAMVKSEQWQQKLKERSWLDSYLSGPEFERFLAEENARVTDILKSVGLVQ
ncbi:MAG: tripartite tricarboxylate transporter substrate binding protein [Hyphomicrobiaceae bacterium]|mgnify:FL=1|jgi:putative tricarboxylic transport membrane protein